MKKTISLKRSSDFSRIYKRGQFYVGRYIIIYVKKNNLANNRLGIIASKKYGKSVCRNRIRRLIRENYRLLEENIMTGYDIVFVARPVDEMPDFSAVKKEMKYLLRKVNILIGQ